MARFRDYHVSNCPARPNYSSWEVPIFFYVFDVLVFEGKDVMRETLLRRRELLETHVLPKLAEPIRGSPVLVDLLCLI